MISGGRSRLGSGGSAAWGASPGLSRKSVPSPAAGCAGCDQAERPDPVEHPPEILADPDSLVRRDQPG